MRKYLATLHKKPDHHKKRFALLVSGSFTMFIFVTWSLVNYGLPTQERVATVQEPQKVAEVTPFSALGDGLATAFKALRGGFGELKEGIQQVDVGGEYQDMRNRAFDSYGR
jgi:hypothetical protein